MNVIAIMIGITLLTSNGCESSISSKEPSNLIYDWQSNAAFANNGEYVAFDGSFNERTAIHFLDKEGLYKGFVLDLTGQWVSSPSWGPDSSLVVSIEGNIFIVSLTTQSLQQITNSFQDFSCAWSPNGKYILWTKSICDPFCGIAIYDLNKDTIVSILNFGSKGKWNKNSNTIYYFHTYYLKRPDSHISDYKGFVFKRYKIDEHVTDSLFYVNTENHYLWPSDFAISPDENEILFSASEGSPPQIYIWKINLTNKSMYKMTIGDYPEYSPDGSIIVYTNTAEGGLWIMNSDGSNYRQFTDHSR